MIMNTDRRKIKSQKNAALFLIIGCLVFCLSYFKNTNFDTLGSNDYIILSSVIVLIICSSIGLINSLRKEKELEK